MATIHRLSADVLSIDVSDETVLLDFQKGIYFGLRGAIRHALDKLTVGATRKEMVAAVVHHYGVSEEVADADIERILARLQAKGLVTTTAPQ